MPYKVRSSQLVDALQNKANQLREMASEREATINDTLAKARKVLEALGIQDALTLPHRYNARKASVGSMNNSIKKRQ